MQPIHDLLNSWPLERIGAQTLLHDRNKPLRQRLRQGGLLARFIQNGQSLRQDFHQGHPERPDISGS
jgi:hypothetical protein